ncbi:glutathione S-transferase [Sandarakinorhabdus cyanobacteriorum]|uniref:Glutathione S-transferase n=1 Tax=Sandarakinorhabdus cyanobacteriorum TaxID=1981098 RepID=A0A255YXZ4_9SPHN|nr:glutathione binding-like protein [Sandarakinorhabdus cyanobacteriorum]OYQ34041.1 glutathione S-transferase [Sandarakinorhabdus cyanobacteriorum]
MAITLFTAPTPDGYKISIALEELGLAYQVQPLDLAKGEQKSAAFLRLNPNGKVPAIVDDGFGVMESGAILVWLAEKTGQLLPADPRARSEALQWLMLQVGGLGPMMGQANLFGHYWPEKLPAVQARYLAEVRRLLAILDARLADRPFLAGEYSIADIAHFCWARTAGWTGVDIAPFPHLTAWIDRVAARPAVQRGLKVPDVSPVKEGGDNSDFIARTRKLLGLGPREA